jgi:hypothetical protein
VNEVVEEGAWVEAWVGVGGEGAWVGAWGVLHSSGVQTSQCRSSNDMCIGTTGLSQPKGYRVWQ